MLKKANHSLSNDRERMIDINSGTLLRIMNISIN